MYGYSIHYQLCRVSAAIFVYGKNATERFLANKFYKRVCILKRNSISEGTQKSTDEKSTDPANCILLMKMEFV